MTAVEWLLDRIEDVDITENIWIIVKNQAKEMEKQQILKAYDKGYEDCTIYEPEQYYNETYKPSA